MPIAASLPTIELPAISDPRTAGNSMSLLLEAWLVPWRRITCDISWPITPANWPSLSTARSRPVLMNIGPPGNAKALMDGSATTSKVKGNPLSCASRPLTRRLPTRVTYSVRNGSWITVSCLRTWAAFSCPSCTSCAFVNRLKPGWNWVGPWAQTKATARIAIIVDAATLFMLHLRLDEACRHQRSAQSPGDHPPRAVFPPIARGARCQDSIPPPPDPTSSPTARPACSV